MLIVREGTYTDFEVEKSSKSFSMPEKEKAAKNRTMSELQLEQFIWPFRCDKTNEFLAWTEDRQSRLKWSFFRRPFLSGHEDSGFNFAYRFMGHADAVRLVVSTGGSKAFHGMKIN